MSVVDLAVWFWGGIWAVKRKQNASKHVAVRKFFSLLFTKYMEQRGSYIGLDAEIRGEPEFPHGILGVFVSSGAHIGSGCVIFHQVTIGSNTLPDSKGRGAPIIGNNVYMGAGAKIIGNVVVGDNVRIGANAVVVKNIPDNHVVVCQAPRLIQKHISSNPFLEFQL